jgi:hypothetical protein
MVRQQIVFWRDIPAEVLIRDGRNRTRAPLSRRFLEAIDMAAMHVGAKDSDAYLAGWRSETSADLDGDPAALAAAAADAIEADYPKARLAALIKSGGFENAGR